MVDTPEGQSEASPARARLRLALAVVFGLAPLVVVPGLYDFANLPQSAFLQLSAAVLVAAALTARVWRPEWPPLAAPLLLWLAWSALSCTWSPNPALALRVWWPWLAAATGYALLFHLADGGADLRPVAAAALAAGVVVATLGIGQAMWGWTFVPQAFPPAATFANKNIAGQFVIGVLPFAFLWMAGSSRARVWTASAAALLLAFVVLTRTRSAAAALVVEAVVLAAGWGRGRRWLWVLPGVAAAVLAVAIALQWRGASAGGAARLSVEGRAAIWRNTLVMIREHPLLGVGLGAHSVMYPAYHRRAVVDPLFSPRTHLDFAHNDYLQLTAEMGLVGVALLAVLGAAFVHVIREARSRGGEVALASAAVASTAGLLTDALFSFPAYRALPPWLLALDAAVLAVLARGPASARGFLIAPPGRRQLLAGVAAIACVALGIAHSRWLRADRHFEAARRAEAKGLPAGMAAEAAEAVALDGARGDAWFSLGTAALLAREPAPAVGALQEAAARDPFNPNTLANLGLARAQTGDRAGAADALRRALAISPGETEVSDQLARLLQEGGDPGAQYRRGLAALRAGRLVEAEEALRSAVTLDPGGASAHKALGVVLLQGGQRGEAAAHFQQALRLDPTIADRAMMERVIADASEPRR